MLSSSDKTILRELARQQLEVAHSEKNQARVALWQRHNALHGERPVIHLELDTFEEEVIPPRLRCESEEGRALETELYRRFLNLTLFDDDWVVPDFFPVTVKTWFHPFGHKITRTFASNHSVGHHFNYVISDLEDDWDKVGKSDFGIDHAGTKQALSLAEDTFGDILPVRLTGSGLYVCLTQDIVHLMGMEVMCFSMYDYPELFCQMMDKLASDYLSFFDLLKQEGLMLPTTGFEHLGQGSRCFTSELPSANITGPGDLWGFMDSQETVSISPKMFADFIFPAYKKVASTFGLLSYGCCEPVHPVWDCIGSLPNLRKASISPWCDEDFMAERLRGSHTIYHRKPSPNYLGVNPELDEEAFRAHIRKTLQTARGCHVEITQRDVYTIHHNEDKARRYVAIIREEIEKNWQP